LLKWKKPPGFRLHHSGPPYPFSYRIHPYGELSSFPNDRTTISWDNLDGWNTENVQISIFLKAILDAGLEESASKSLNVGASHPRLPVYSTWSEKVVYCLVNTLSSLEFDGLLSKHDCSALSLTHPALTRPSQKLMLRNLLLKTDLQIRNALDALRIHHDLLPLVDALHLDSRMASVASSRTSNELVNLVSPWLTEISISSNGSAEGVSHFESMAFSPGLRSIAVRSAQSSMASPRAMPWPLYWMKHDGLFNLKHFLLAGVDLHFDSTAEWVSGLESFTLEHCHVHSSGENSVSLLHVLKGSQATLRSLRLTSVEGVSPESVKDTIHACPSLEHLRLSNVCQRTCPPISLRSALAGKSFVTLLVSDSGFGDYSGFTCERKSSSHLWYGENGEDWDRTHYDHWLLTLHVKYHDGGSYESFKSDDED
jgi:hypothetical protein